MPSGAATLYLPFQNAQKPAPEDPATCRRRAVSRSWTGAARPFLCRGGLTLARCRSSFFCSASAALSALRRASSSSFCARRRSSSSNFCALRSSSSNFWRRFPRRPLAGALLSCSAASLSCAKAVTSSAAFAAPRHPPARSAPREQRLSTAHVAVYFSMPSCSIAFIRAISSGAPMRLCGQTMLCAARWSAHLFI